LFSQISSPIIFPRNKQNNIQQLRRSFFALAIAGATLTLPSANARTIAVQGSWTDCQRNPVFQSFPYDAIITWDITIYFTGTFDGTWEGTEEDVVYSDGYFIAHGIGTFTGSVSGRSGTIRITYLATGSPPGRVISPWVVDEGTGDLAGLHGSGTRPQGACYRDWPYRGGDTTFRGVNVGQVQFAP
jgi:hypothetical protein